MNAEVIDLTHQESLATHIQRRRLAVFGHVRRLSDTTPAHTALRLSIDARSGRRVGGRPACMRPTNTWVHQMELDLGMAADTAWNAATDRDVWMTRRPTVGLAV